MPTYAVPPTLTDAIILFRDLAAANAFFELFALPDADPDNRGTVFQADSVTYTHETYTPVYYDLITVNADLSQTTTQLPSKDDYDELKDRFDTLSTSVQTLINNLKLAGILES